MSGKKIQPCTVASAPTVTGGSKTQIIFGTVYLIKNFNPKRRTQIKRVSHEKKCFNWGHRVRTCQLKKKNSKFWMTFRKCNRNRMKKIVMVKNRFEALFWFWKCKNIRLKNISKFVFSIYLFWVYFITHKNTHFYKPHQIFCKFYIKSTASMTNHASASNQSVNHMIQFLICLCFTNCLHVYFFLIASLPTMSYRYMCQDKIALNVF